MPAPRRLIVELAAAALSRQPWRAGSTCR